jgi:hypothetical protein
MHHKQKNWLTKLLLEAENAINLLPAEDRNFYRKQVSQKINHLNQQDKHTNTTHPYTNTERNTLNSIKAKLATNNATITTADKGSTLVILPTAQYHNKIKDFITNNNFQTSNTDPTPRYQKQIRKTINDSSTLINKNQKWKYTNLNPSAPTLKGLIKLHKTDQPIRPVVNWQNAPAYKLAKLLSQKIQDLSPLPYTFNINNTTELIDQLKQTPITPHSKFASLDISNMYANVPIKDKTNTQRHTNTTKHPSRPNLNSSHGTTQ